MLAEKLEDLTVRLPPQITYVATAKISQAKSNRTCRMSPPPPGNPSRTSRLLLRKRTPNSNA